jgi:hypothetical protein
MFSLANLGQIKALFSSLPHLQITKANFELNLKPKLPVACVTSYFFVGDLFNFRYFNFFNEFNFSLQLRF